MRRLVLIVLMLVLPLQWSWAAAASVCGHEAQARSAHFGHHEHVHQGAEPAVDSEAQSPSSGAHPDCGTCHATGLPLPPSVGSVAAAWADAEGFAPYACAVPDRALDTPLRPPMRLVA